MFNDADHPNVSLSDWKAFKASEAAGQSFIMEVVDRGDCGSFPTGTFP